MAFYRYIRLLVFSNLIGFIDATGDRTFIDADDNTLFIDGNGIIG